MTNIIHSIQLILNIIQILLTFKTKPRFWDFGYETTYETNRKKGKVENLVLKQLSNQRFACLKNV